MIATHPAQCGKKLEFYRQKNLQALKMSGEPFVLDQKSLHNGQFLVLLLGPGHFWKCRITGAIGHGIDSRDRDELHSILEHRRQGEIWGKWYSELCPTGEIGCNHYSRVIELDEIEFRECLSELQAKR